MSIFDLFIQRFEVETTKFSDKKSISAIRSALDLKRIIYVACNPKAAERNWLDLCKPESKTYRGDPFRPKKAIAVDMFPHTSHTELVMLLER